MGREQRARAGQLGHVQQMQQIQQMSAQQRQHLAQQAIARGQFTAAVEAKKTGAIDRIGHMIEPRQLVIWNPPPTITLWAVTAVEPVTDPQKPIGLMKVTITAQVPLEMFAGQAQQNLLIVGQQEGDQAAIDPGAVNRLPGEPVAAEEVESPESDEQLSGGASVEQPSEQVHDDAPADPLVTLD